MTKGLMRVLISLMEIDLLRKEFSGLKREKRKEACVPKKISSKVSKIVT
jgi:hypothetical protein